MVASIPPPAEPGPILTFRRRRSGLTEPVGPDPCKAVATFLQGTSWTIVESARSEERFRRCKTVPTSNPEIAPVEWFQESASTNLVATPEPLRDQERLHGSRGSVRRSSVPNHLHLDPAALEPIGGFRSNRCLAPATTEVVASFASRPVEARSVAQVRIRRRGGGSNTTPSDVGGPVAPGAPCPGGVRTVGLVRLDHDHGHPSRPPPSGGVERSIRALG